MSVITYRIGDATKPDSDGPWVIAHCCNDAGAWGAGFSGAISKKWPHVGELYKRWYWYGQSYSEGAICATPFELGRAQFVAADGGWMANIIGQHGVKGDDAGPPIRYGALDMGLCRVASWAYYHKADVHMPLIGAGLASGDWGRIEAIIERAFGGWGVSVTVYLLPNK